MTKARRLSSVHSLRRRHRSAVRRIGRQCWASCLRLCFFNRQARCCSALSSDGTINSGQSHELLLKFVQTLSHDLLLGIHGASGGLTGDLFLSIRIASTFVLELWPSWSQVNQGDRRFVCVHESRDMLEGSLCCHSKGSAILETMMLTSHTPFRQYRGSSALFFAGYAGGDTSDTCTPSIFAAASFEAVLGYHDTLEGGERIYRPRRNAVFSATVMRLSLYH
jgi:hypothetical protein